MHKTPGDPPPLPLCRVPRVRRVPFFFSASSASSAGNPCKQVHRVGHRPCCSPAETAAPAEKEGKELHPAVLRPLSSVVCRLSLAPWRRCAFALTALARKKRKGPKTPRRQGNLLCVSAFALTPPARKGTQGRSAAWPQPRSRVLALAPGSDGPAGRRAAKALSRPK